MVTKSTACFSISRRTQPELPDIGIGDRPAALAARARPVAASVSAGLLAAQQHLVADDDRLDRLGIAPWRAQWRS